LYHVVKVAVVGKLQRAGFLIGGKAETTRMRYSRREFKFMIMFCLNRHEKPFKKLPVKVQ
jgi:hypothetical protein